MGVRVGFQELGLGFGTGVRVEDEVGYRDGGGVKDGVGDSELRFWVRFSKPDHDLPTVPKLDSDFCPKTCLDNDTET
ncbi:hypothetical protein TIFTF001_016792 [Ficus carica]|uniref:Uncharacterized protein n=1 Tax=Ficus carica TaxID=3494 RepID=A0AA88ATQ4_FICCA|nr:hypothetical protein TIFTF001_016792 [Ficus carica]